VGRGIRRDPGRDLPLLRPMRGALTPGVLYMRRYIFISTIVGATVLVSPQSNCLPAETVHFSVIPGTDPIFSFTGVDDYQCFRYARYMVATGRMGYDIYVKNIEGKDSYVPCKQVIKAYDFVLKNESFWGIRDKLLFVDSGTGPDPRILLIYDLEKKERVFKGDYSSPITLKEDGGLYFWQASDVATKDNCPRYDELREGGLGAAIETKVVLDLENFIIRKTTETRCAPRQ